jgi:hypothetical protein
MICFQLTAPARRRSRPVLGSCGICRFICEVVRTFPRIGSFGASEVFRQEAAKPSVSKSLIIVFVPQAGLYEAIGPFIDNGRSTFRSGALIVLTQPSQPESGQFCSISGIFAGTSEDAAARDALPVSCAGRRSAASFWEIETDGEIDLLGFLGIDLTVSPGYESLSYLVRIKGSGTKEEFAEIHEAVMATSPNFYLAQLLQRVPARGPQTDPRRRVIDGLEARRPLWVDPCRWVTAPHGRNRRNLAIHHGIDEGRVAALLQTAIIAACAIYAPWQAA